MGFIGSFNSSAAIPYEIAQKLNFSCTSRGDNMMSDRIYYSREAEVRAQRERTMMAIVLLGFGLGVGAIMALLFAPRSGEETRKDITDRIEPRLDHARDVTNTTVENLQRDLSRLRDEMETRLHR